MVYKFLHAVRLKHYVHCKLLLYRLWRSCLRGISYVYCLVKMCRLLLPRMREVVVGKTRAAYRLAMGTFTDYLRQSKPARNGVPRTSCSTQNITRQPREIGGVCSSTLGDFSKVDINVNNSGFPAVRGCIFFSRSGAMQKCVWRAGGLTTIEILNARGLVFVAPP